MDSGRKKKLKLILLIVAIGVALLYIPAGILVSDGLEAEKLSIGKGETTIKIAHISDLHYPNDGVSPETIAEELARFSPDLIFLTGDIFDSSATKDNINDLRSLLSVIGSYRYSYMVLGNHDTLLYNLDYLKEILSQNNILLLENDSTEIEIKGKKLGIAGISDKHPYGQENMENLSTLTPGIPILLLAHRPEKWKEYLSATDDRVPLVTFSGHAHGGQIQLFGVGVYSPASGWFPKYYDGLYHSDRSFLIVSRGLGDSTFPYRVYNRYHLPCIELKL